MATQQPMAGDLRELLAALFIASELERIGDHAEGNGRIALMLGTRPEEGPLDALTEMTQKAASMLRRAIDAFVRRDPEAARSVSAEDDEVDMTYSRVITGLIQRGGISPDDLPLVTYLMWTAHNIERVADRVTNICERVIFMTTGRLEEVNVSRY
jgi:phosphate transport system protein